MKTYIVSCYFQNNYGSMLQAYATQKFLDLSNIDNETIRIDQLKDFKKGKRKYYRTQLFNASFYKTKLGMIKLLIKKKVFKRSKLAINLRKRGKKFNEFKNRYFRLTESYETYSDLSKLCEKAANVIVGSDQLWLPVNVVADYYTLNFVPENVNKVSYSTSFGVSKIPKKFKEKYQRFLPRINHLSVREDSGKTIVSEFTDKNCEVVCDPTILLRKEEWEKIIEINPVIEGDYILCYFLGKNINHRLFAENLKKITGYKIVSINHCDEYVKYSDALADETPYDIGPSEWLNLIKNAKYVCTDSFHGTVFSLIFNRPFFSFKRYASKSKFSTNGRLDTLLNIVDLSNRVFNGEENEKKITELIQQHIDFDKANSRLESYRQSSQQWFLKSLIYEQEKLSKGINISYKKDCCGCSACYSICPKKAITMEEDSEGFLYPKVDQNTCIDCHLCEKVCPIKNRKEEVPKAQRGFLIRNLDEQILEESTSGGAFSAFAKAILDEGGVVFGACFDDAYNVHHISVLDEKDLNKFRNSKYVQSDLEKTFEECKSYLLMGRKVLFSGTPCQIEGLKSFLGKNYDNLYLIDVVCRSVPSRLLWRKYIEFRRQKNKNISPVAFRDKSRYGYEYSQMRFDDGERHYSGVESDPYLRAFFSDLAVRPSCYNCKFKKRYRESDLTLWDCFPIQKFEKSLDDNKGVTRCLTHSLKGTKMVESIKEDCIIKEIDSNFLVNDSKEMVCSVKRNGKRDLFFEDIYGSECELVFKKWFADSYKIKIKRFGRALLEKLNIYRPVKRFVKKLLHK